MPDAIPPNGMRTTPSLDRQTLKRLLHYSPESGLFTWLVKSNGRVRVGQTAGSPNSDGYIQIKIFRRLYGAHRLAWLYVYGYWPPQEIDHINGNVADNRIENLREANRHEQMWNRKRPVTNTSGFKGVSFYKRRDCWRANIANGGKLVHLGYFKTPEAAHEAYVAAAKAIRGDYVRSE